MEPCASGCRINEAIQADAEVRRPLLGLEVSSIKIVIRGDLVRINRKGGPSSSSHEAEHGSLARGYGLISLS
jgi:hypothetical protein